MNYAIMADSLPRPVTETELNALLGRLDRQGLQRRDERGVVVERTPCAAVAHSLREQLDAGKTTLTIPATFRSDVLGLLHFWVGESDWSERLMEIRYALHAELTVAA